MRKIILALAAVAAVGTAELHGRKPVALVVVCEEFGSD